MTTTTGSEEGQGGIEDLPHALLARQTLEEKPAAFVEAHVAALHDGQVEEALRTAAKQEPEGSGRRCCHACLVPTRTGVQEERN